MPIRSVAGTWTPSLTTYSREGKESQSATAHSSSARHDFLSFLGVAQSLKIDFLPILWQPALEAIGEGATAQVREALVNIQASFAFKRFHHHRAWNEAEFYEILIAEISILGNSSIRDHPNIVRIEGICWDILAEQRKVYPVIVTRKAPHGNLDVFMTRGEGRNLSFESRLGLCYDIGFALRDMHLCHIVHGDIKPVNILIYPQNTSEYTAKLTDFGFSSLLTGEDEFIHMPRSGCWTAPEWHHRGFNTAAAMKMDTFSFGMVCAWILVLSNVAIPTEHLQETLPYSTQVLLQCFTFTDSLTDIDPRGRRQLRCLFELSLARDPAGRASNLDILLNLFPRRGAHSSGLQELVTTEISLPLERKGFSVLPSISQLTNAHYVLRQFIVKCLERRLSDTSDVQQEALELAFCLRLGWGVDRDITRATNILIQYGFPTQTLDDMINHVASSHYPEPEFQPGAFRDYTEQGYISNVSHTRQDIEQGRFETVKAHYLREIRDLELALGKAHYLLQHLRIELDDILETDARSNDLEKHRLEMLEIAQQTAIDSDVDITAYKLFLSRTYSDQGRYAEAQKLEEEAVDFRKERYGIDHPHTLQSTAILARTYSNLGEILKAESLQAQVFATSRELFGIEHISTLKAAGNLALTYINLGRIPEAEELLLLIIPLSRQMLGSRHTTTLSNLSSLGSLYSYQDRYEDEESIRQQILGAQESYLRPDHPDILQSKANLASVYAYRGQLDKSLSIHRDILNVREKSLGLEHPDTISSLSELGYFYGDQGRWDEAEVFQRRALDISTRTLGLQHPNTLAEMEALSTTLMWLERPNEAEKFILQAINVHEATLGPEHPFTLELNCELATIYSVTKLHSKARKLAIEVTSVQKRVLGPENSSTVHGLKTLAAVYNRFHNPEAESWQDIFRGEHIPPEDIEELISTILRLEPTSAADYTTTLQILESLVLTFQSEANWGRFERSMRGIVEKREQTQRPNDTLTLTSRASLATAIYGQGRFGESCQIEREVLAARLSVLGPENPDTMDSMMNLALSCRWQDENQIHESIELATQVLRFREEYLGEDHPDTREVASTLENWHKIVNKDDTRKKTPGFKGRIISQTRVP